MDTSESVIETARSFAKAEPARYLTFEVGNIYEPRFPAESFDAIFAHQVLQHCVDQSMRCGNFGRFLHPAGSSAFVTLIGEAQRFIRKTKEFAASWLFIMNSHDVTAGSPTLGVTFDIGSATRDLSKLV